MKVARRVLYSGRVQGVGFRYQTNDAAQEYKVDGYVQNLPGGEVELFVEGEEETVTAFLNEVADRMGSKIHNAAVSLEAVTGVKGFCIR